MQIQEAQRVPKNPKRTTPRQNVIKMPKVKDKHRLLRAAGVRKLATRWLPDGAGGGEWVKR